MTGKEGTELLIMLDEKFDKCDWKKESVAMVPPRISLTITSGKILMSIDTVMVFNNNAQCVLEYKTGNYNELQTIALIWKKAAEKIQAPIDAYLLRIINELDKL